MDDEIRRLPDSELEIMQVLWNLNTPIPRSQVEEMLWEIHPMAQTTLLTLLSRLAEKGFIRTVKDGRSSMYVPLISKRDYLAVQSDRFFEKLCGGNMQTFVTALYDSHLSRENLAELRRLLDENEL